MEKNLGKLLSFFLLATLITSCGALKKYNQKLLEDNFGEGVDKKDKVFYIAKDSAKIIAKTIDIKQDYLGKLLKFTADGKEIKLANIIAFQNNLPFTTYTPLTNFRTYRVTLGPVSVYNGLYSYNKRVTTTTNTYQGGNLMGSTDRYSLEKETKSQLFVQKYNGQLIAASRNNIESMISDHAPAIDMLAEYDSNKKKYKIIGLVNTIVGVGGVILGGAFGTKGEDITTLGYVGIGMSVGSLVFRGINRKNKRNNEAFLIEDVILEYNQAKSKKIR